MLPLPFFFPLTILMLRSSHHLSHAGDPTEGKLCNMTQEDKPPTQLPGEHDYTDFTGRDNGPVPTGKLRP